ncbi:MAG: 50S ribosomal protein L25/general stress protein Ctc [Proteobacteria bacterium]|uniref:Large ribosomal subunit protein bL25 n=1 Tax=Candidatus Enterousia excrementavium TaxID=2840789 RepID=A0A940DEY4_9PROT|nr:50S ribosomal protein L25/general stress protein Ctc [Candidatus Enterousia excrementavium]
MAIKLNAEIRNAAGKGAARSIRKNNNIPAVVYGEKKAPSAIELNGRDFDALLQTPSLRTKLIEIDTPAGHEDAMLMDIQYHPVTDKVIHVDFKRIDVKKPVNVSVPVEVINAETSKGIKLGGVLNFAVRKVALRGLVHNIPEKITIDLANLNIGDSVHGSDLILPEGVELGLHQAELAFATIGGKMPDEENSKPAAAAAAAPAAEAKK